MLSNYLEELYLFVQVVELGSFTEAAERLKLSKSHVSKSIKRLEKALQVQLMLRHARRLQLTQAGETLYPYGQKLCQLAEQTEQAMTETASGLLGRLKIAAAPLFGELLTRAVIPAFIQAHPAIEVELHISNAFVDIIEGGFDLALRTQNLADSSLYAKRLCSYEHHVYASQAFIAEKGRPESPHALNRLNACVYTYSQRFRRWHFHSQTGQTESVVLQGNYQTNEIYSLLAAVKAGIGFSILPAFALAEHDPDGQLVRLFADYQLKTTDLYALYPAAEYLPKKVRLFLAACQTYFQTGPSSQTV